MTIPKVTFTPSTEELRDAIREYLEHLESAERHEDRDGDYENEIFEKAVEAFCPPDIWDWINERKA
jgi:hypothetical protein